MTRPGAEAAVNLDHPLAPAAWPAERREGGPGSAEAPWPPLFPWEDPELGAWRGLGRTLAGLLLGPGRFFSAHRPGSRASAPLALGWLTLSAGLTLALTLPPLAAALTVPPYAAQAGWLRARALLGAAGAVTLAPLAALALLLLVGLGLHLCLRLSGAGRRGLGETWRVVGYAATAGLFLPLPRLGPWLTLGLGLTVLATGLARRHRLGPLHLAAAVLLPPFNLALLLLLIGGRG